MIFLSIILLATLVTCIAFRDEFSDNIRDYFNVYTVTSHEDRYLHLPYLPKQSYSNYTRFVFFAGLGGVGHHAIEQVYHKCNMNCGETRNISGLLWNSDLSSLFVFQKERVLLDVSRDIIHKFKEYNNRSVSSIDQPTKYYFLNCYNGYSMLSYPRYFVSQNKYEPNVHILGTLAEYASIDYRVVVMTRDPLNSILSVLLRFTHGSTLNDIKRYIDQFSWTQKHLIRQIEKMDRNFLSCMKYEKMVSDSRNAHNRIFNLNNSFNFTDAINSVFRDTGKSSMAHQDDKIVTLKGAVNITYGDIKSYVNLKMRKDYDYLQQLCDELSK